MKISIIVPVYNEQEILQDFLTKLTSRVDQDLIQEIILVDGGSTDSTPEIAKSFDITFLQSPHKGRAIQMNYGANLAKGDILHFIHADSIPPVNFCSSILKAISARTQAGCFMSKFDLPHWFLRLGNYFSFLPFWFCRGGGQTLFITKLLFDKLGGYNEKMRIMEEYDLITRIKRISRFRVIRRFVLTSARDYRKHGPMRLQFIYMKLFRMYARGASQDVMLSYLNEKLNK